MEKMTNLLATFGLTAKRKTGFLLRQLPRDSQLEHHRFAGILLAVSQDIESFTSSKVNKDELAQDRILLEIFSDYI